MIKRVNKLVLGISLLFSQNKKILVISITAGCGMGKEAEIKKSFEKTLSMYPIKNLEDLYDKEGYRDDQFDKNDKGTWIVNSQMATQNKGEALKVKGMVLYMNRNTKTTKGYYYVNAIKNDKDGRPQENEKRYPVKMVDNKIIPTKEIKDKNIKKEIENFKFFVQYGNFKDLSKYKDGDISYNPEVPSYSAKYQLTNDDYNVKQLRKRYDIPTNKAPKLLLKGTGNLKGSSVGYKDIEFTFVEKKGENIYFISFLILVISITAGCSMGKEAEIKKSFEKTLSMYPIKNLEDLYDKEGYRDDQFDKNDKGTWIVNSQMATQNKGEALKIKGMVLYMNRNTKTTKGYYYVNAIKKDGDGRPQDNKIEYPVKMVDNKIIPTKGIKDENIKKEIENFKFFAQYGSFKDLSKYKDGDISYNPEVPSYSAKYQLTNDDYNVKQLRKRYKIPTNKAPKLLLKGSGDLKGSSVGYKDIEFTFVEKKGENTFFTDSLHLEPSEDK
ncbi:tandem-type lipoprotein [Staphylococcus aureus]